MQKERLFLFILIFVSSYISAQDSYWNSIDYNQLKLDSNEVIDTKFDVKNERYFSLDKESVTLLLSAAPNRLNTTSSNVILEIPTQNGKLEAFQMFSTTSMASQLSTNFSEIKSYVGKSTNAKNASILRVTITPQGFYAMILKPNIGQVFINPIDKSGNYYMVFKKSNAENQSSLFYDVIDNGIENNTGIVTQSALSEDNSLIVFKLALACTGEYSQFHITQAGLENATTLQQITAVLGAMVVAIDRVNSIYERDLSVSFQLVPDNDQLIYLDSDLDPYSNYNVYSMLDENQTNIDTTIGFSNYDIGHVFSTAGGGVATLASLCTDSKAKAVTGSPNPVGDPFAVDFLSHELGHQFGATHTHNNDCQRSAETAVEPGSGNTIMAYAGICPPNVQENSDAYFHSVSIKQMQNYISSTAFCGSSITITNNAPNISELPNYIIPKGTPFYLDVTALDIENDALTYNWEQINTTLNPPIDPLPRPISTSGPNFRSLPSSLESRRYFPDFQSVLINELAPTWEVIPSISRQMDFSIIVRDNNVHGGQVAMDYVSVDFSNAGPFQVTSQNEIDIHWKFAERRTISWDVAGTNANGVNTNYVNILLSTDGGLSFEPLVLNTPNDGEEEITVSNIKGEVCRIMVEAVDNIFYAINTTPFSINKDSNTICSEFKNNTTEIISDGLGTAQNIQFGSIGTSNIYIPTDIANINDVSIILNITHSYIGELRFTLERPDGETLTLWNQNCSDGDSFNITFNDFGLLLPDSGLDCPDPFVGVYQDASPSMDLKTFFSFGTQGHWKLSFADSVMGDTGMLNSWGIEVCSSTFSVIDNQLRDFNIFPNPNNGEFTINFSSLFSNDMQLNVYDLKGRLIENLDLKNSSLSQGIQLKKYYQSGLYLLEIVGDGIKSVEKLVIK